MINLGFSTFMICQIRGDGEPAITLEFDLQHKVSWFD